MVGSCRRYLIYMPICAAQVVVLVICGRTRTLAGTWPLWLTPIPITLVAVVGAMRSGARVEASQTGMGNPSTEAAHARMRVPQWS